MAVLYYADLRRKLSEPSSRVWLGATFGNNPASVAVVIAPYPVPGAAQWFVETREIAEQVAKKLGTCSRVWTLDVVRDYLSCFGVAVAGVREAAMQFDREAYEMDGEA